MTTQVVGVARTGGLTTTVVNTVTGMTDPAKEPDLEPSAGLLATRGLRPVHAARTPAAARRPRSSSDVLAGPGRQAPRAADRGRPAAGARRSTSRGSAPSRRKAKENLAATRCDDTDFTGPGFTEALTRTFVIPAATELPPEFGLTETVGALPPQAGAGLRRRHPRQARRLPRRRPRHRRRAARRWRRAAAATSTVWRLTVEVSEERSVRFLMAVIRKGNAVAQLTFVPSEDVSIGAEPFVALARRAQDRLRQLATPAYDNLSRGRGSHPRAPTRPARPGRRTAGSPAAAPSGPPRSETRRICQPGLHADRPTSTPSAEPRSPTHLDPARLGYDDENGDDHSPVVVTDQPGTRAFEPVRTPVWDPRAGTTDLIGVEFRGEAEWSRGRTLVLYPSDGAPRAAAVERRPRRRSPAARRSPAEPGYGTTHDAARRRRWVTSRSCGPTRTGSSATASSCTTPA